MKNRIFDSIVGVACQSLCERTVFGDGGRANVALGVSHENFVSPKRNEETEVPHSGDTKGYCTCGAKRSYPMENPGSLETNSTRTRREYSQSTSSEPYASAL